MPGNGLDADIPERPFVCGRSFGELNWASSRAYDEPVCDDCWLRFGKIRTVRQCTGSHDDSARYSTVVYSPPNRVRLP